MAENIQIDLMDNSKYRVAYDLARLIGHAEKDTAKDRDYWLNLYADCLSVASHHRPTTDRKSSR